MFVGPFYPLANEVAKGYSNATIRPWFINAISGSLICQPDFRNSKDKTRSSLLTMANNLVVYDPEFILKVQYDIILLDNTFGLLL